MKLFEIEGHKPSLLPEGEWELVFADEFDGDTLDRTKWDFRLDFWGRPFEGYTDKGIVLDGKSHIELHRVEKNGYYVSPQLQTGANSFDAPLKSKEIGLKEGWAASDEIWKLGELSPMKFSHIYGYYECRCKMQKYPEEMWSAFWLQAPGIGTTYDPTYSGIEVDIMEYPEKNVYSCGNIWGGYGAQFTEEGRVQRVPLAETADGFHTFGVLWDEDGYTFYCDGKEISKASKFVSRVPQFILLTTEVRGHRKNTPVKVEGAFVDDAFIVDYVRVFDRKERKEGKVN